MQIWPSTCTFEQTCVYVYQQKPHAKQVSLHKCQYITAFVGYYANKDKVKFDMNIDRNVVGQNYIFKQCFAVKQ